MLSKFSPGFFDLIIFDESHRSIFNRFTDVIEYFDRRMIGLTATPANFIDRDTFRVFHCDGNQNIVCRLRHAPTVDFLKKEFGVA